jgi:hypothetical protein
MKRRSLTAILGLAVLSSGLAGTVRADVPELIAPAGPAGGASGTADVPSNTVALRVRLGQKDRQPGDWSGSIKLASGKVLGISGWRWNPGDHAQGESWTVQTHRLRANEQPREVPTNGQGPVEEVGVIINLIDVDPSEKITLDTKKGSADFTLSDLSKGQHVHALNGGVEIERVPLVTPLAKTWADEDYPTTATAKDGTIYVAYVAFTRGKDFQGVRERVASPESGPESPLFNGLDVRHINTPADFDYLQEPAGGEQIYLKSLKNGKWSSAVPVTDGTQEIYRPSLAVDGSGKVWVFYPAHLNAGAKLEDGDWDLVARSFDPATGKFSDVVNISNAPGNDFLDAAATDSKGRVWVSWIGQRDGNFHVFSAHQTDSNSSFTAGTRVTSATGNEWEPAIAADKNGNVTIAWDTYQKGDYDVYLAKKKADDSFGDPQAVAATLAFEVRPSVVYDTSDRLWIAWEQSGDNWGKAFGALKKKGIPLYSGNRELGLKVLDSSGQWYQAPDPAEALLGTQRAGGRQSTVQPGKPAQPIAKRDLRPQLGVAPCFPRLFADSKGQVFLAFRGRQGANWRVGVGSVWFEFLSKLDGDTWEPAQWIPRSNNILDNRPALAETPDGQLKIILSGDGRGEVSTPHVEDPNASDDVTTQPAQAAQGAQETIVGAGGNQNRRGRAGAAAGADPNDDIYLATESLDADGVSAAPKLVPIEAEVPAKPTQDTLDEQAAIAAARDFRIHLNDETLRIWRGEFHRHTELSPDGGGDGGLLDMWRYAIDAVGFDWIGDGDHDYGNGREYSWWTTQKAVTLFTIPDRFTPVFSYERSVVYPEGHRNVMFAHRGVRSLPRLPLSSPDDGDKPAPDTNLLYKYLHHFGGLTAAHTTATSMGTDWRNNDPEVEPFVEIYQGDRNSYERPDAPRSAVHEAQLKQSTPEDESFGGYRPKGYVNLALLKGYRLAFESSSDHISTHLSFCNVVVTNTSREGILDAIRKRRVYGATDNILADVKVKAGGVDHLFGEEFTTKEPVTLNIHLVGARTLATVTIIKDDKVVFTSSPNTKDVKLDWTDPNPTVGRTSYYYVRGQQVPDMEGAEGEMVWVSPFWIKYQPQ